MNRIDFRFAEKLRVRWAEIDAQQIVFNGHYLMYFDTAIAGYWRALALPYHETMQALQGDLYVRKATLDYLGSARYDDVIDVGVRCERIGTSSIRFACGVFRQGTALVTGELVYVFADPATQTSKPVPQSLRRTLESFEAGGDMVQVKAGSWAELAPDARRLRTEVFVQEQGVPEAMEWDDADDRASHVVAYNTLGLALGTGRLYVDATGHHRIGRVAVTARLRSAGVGQAMLDRLVELARAQGAQQVVLSSQTSAAAFYARAGFLKLGPEFEEAGIRHVEMSRSLRAITSKSQEASGLGLGH
jgi:YbgC/YbaW family acyl-CoA thioester hydrolase